MLKRTFSAMKCGVRNMIDRLLLLPAHLLLAPLFSLQVDMSNAKWTLFHLLMNATTCASELMIHVMSSGGGLLQHSLSTSHTYPRGVCMLPVNQIDPVPNHAHELFTPCCVEALDQHPIRP